MAPTGTSIVVNPMALNTKVELELLNARENLPCASVTVPWLVPLTRTDTPGRTPSETELTIPEMFLFVPKSEEGQTATINLIVKFSS